MHVRDEHVLEPGVALALHEGVPGEHEVDTIGVLREFKLNILISLDAGGFVLTFAPGL